MKIIILLILILNLSYSGESTFKLDIEIEEVLEIVNVSKFKGTCEHFIALATLAISLPQGSNEQVFIINYWDKIAKGYGLTLTKFGRACDQNRLKYVIYYASLDRSKKVLDKDSK